MRNIKYILLTFILTSTVISCDDFGDTNINLNGAENPATSGLLGGAIMNYATFTGRTGVTIPTLLVQYQAQVTYTDEMLYAQSHYGWNTYYGIMKSLTMIIDICSDVNQQTIEVLANGSADNQKGVAQIFRAIVMKRVADVYGDAPFSAAFQGLVEVTPAYDTQESIYKAIIADLKAGRDLLKAAEKGPTGDILYGGSVAKWKKLANSVIMQAALQLSKKYPNVGQYAEVEYNAALTSGPITALADEAWFTYQDAVGFRSPWFANRTADYFLSAEFVNALNGKSTTTGVVLYTGGPTINTVNPTSNRTADDRKKVYVRHNHQARNGVPYGYETGSGSSRAQMSVYYYWNATATIPLMTASYTYLNRAEAVELGWNNADNAQAMLQLGIERSFESLEAKAQKADNAAGRTPTTLNKNAYVTARLAQVGVDASRLTIIREEKWISLFGQAYDAWAEWRRTGVPALAPATDSYNGGVIPRRFMYPGEEATLNSTNYNAAVSNLTPGNDDNVARTWWDK